ncbi:DUF11 domain-containing protein, partial [Chloroflexota bacterium]
IDLNGSHSANKPDRLQVCYDDSDDNTYDPDPVASGGDLVAEFHAANNTDADDPPDLYQTNNHTRAVTATGGLDPDQVWLDFQIPITALVNKLGEQQVLPSTDMRLFYSTSTNENNPLLKDWMQDPLTFGDPLNPNIEATKADSLFDDADSSGGYSPGDTILYTIVITNDGNVEANGVTFADTDAQMDANTTLVDGSVTTTQGTVTSGNGGGPDTSVGVDVGNMIDAATATITFKVTINDPLVPATTVQLENQGMVSGINVDDEPTDDPDTGTDDDPTVTPVCPPPFATATNDGPYCVGDTITLTGGPGGEVLRTAVSGETDADGVSVTTDNTWENAITTGTLNLGSNNSDVQEVLVTHLDMFPLFHRLVNRGNP